MRFKSKEQQAAVMAKLSTLRNEERSDVDKFNVLVHEKPYKDVGKKQFKKIASREQKNVNLLAELEGKVQSAEIGGGFSFFKGKETPSEETPVTRYSIDRTCPYDGTTVPAGQTFCPECGKRVD